MRRDQIERKSFEYSIPASTPLTETEKRENEMRLAFFKKAEEILRQEDRFTKKAGNLRVGLEVEYSVLTGNFSQATELERNRIVESNPDFADVELGAAQLEWRTNPLYLNKEGITALEDAFKVNEEKIRKSTQEQDLYLLRAGSNPFVLISEIKRTNKPKYQQVPDYHNNNKRWGLDTKLGISKDEDEIVDVRDASVVALMNSIQCNVEASSFADGIEKVNRSFMIGPMAVALAGNARFLEGKDTKMSDIRMIAWEKSHDTRSSLETEQGRITRIGLPGLYYLDLRDYFQRVSSYPFILYDPDHAFQIGIGLNWRDARIKFIENSIVVEFRPVSTQPTVKENIAIMLFYLGRIYWSIQNREPLMNLKLVEQNRNQAMYFGLRSKLWTYTDKGVELLPAEIALNLELERAIKGLMFFGFSAKEIDCYFEILRMRLYSKENPSDQLARRFYYYYNSFGYSRKESLVLALNDNGSLI